MASSLGLIAATYGLVRLAYGLVLPDVRAELSMGAGTAGLISSGGSLAYCAAAAVAFTLPTRPRTLVVAAALTAGGGALGMATASGVLTFAAFAVVSSAGAGLASPALVAIIGRSVDPSVNDRAQTIVNAGTGPGLVAAGVLALALLSDWRMAWLVAATCTVLAAAAVLALDRHGPAPVDRGPTLPPPAWFSRHLSAIVAALLLGAGSAAVWTYGRALLVDAGTADVITVTAWIAVGLGGTAVVLTAAPMSRLHPRAAWALTATCVAGSTALLGASPQHAAPAMVACAVFGWSFVAASGALIAWTARLDETHAAAGTSLLFVMLVLGQAAGSAAVGAIMAATDGRTAFLVAAALAAAAAGVSVRRVRDRSRRLPATSGSPG